MSKHNEVNDVPGIFAKDSRMDLEKKAYAVWKGIFYRLQDKQVDPRWYYLSNFLEDLPNIEGFEEWRNDPTTTVSGAKYTLAMKEGANCKVYMADTVFFTRAETAIHHHIQKKPLKSVAENDPTYRLHGIGINDVFGVAHRKTRLYRVWESMLAVVAENRATVCEEWKTLSKFLEDLPNIQGSDLLVSQTDLTVELQFKDMKSPHYSPTTTEFMLRSDALIKRWQHKGRAIPIKLVNTKTNKEYNFCSASAAESFLHTTRARILYALDTNSTLGDYKVLLSKEAQFKRSPKVRAGREVPVTVTINNKEILCTSVLQAAELLRVKPQRLRDMLRGKSPNPAKAGFSIRRNIPKRQYSKLLKEQQ